MKKDKRFEIVYQEGGFMGAKTIYVDKETGVNYLFIVSGYAGGFLQPAEERPTNDPIAPWMPHGRRGDGSWPGRRRRDNVCRYEADADDGELAEAGRVLPECTATG